MKRFFIPLAALFSLVAPALTRAAPPIYPGVVPYEQLDTRNFYLGNYPILRIMPFMPKDTPPYLPVDTWSFAVNTNLWTLYAYDPPNTTWHQVLGLGGIAVTINPTDTVMPYRVDATTFGDSPWSVPGAGQAYADGANAFLHLDLATGNSAYHTTTPNSTLAIYPQMLMEQVPAMGDTVSTTTMVEGMLVSNPTPSTAAAPENSPSMYWGGSAWSTNGAASTPMAFAAVGVPRNAANIPTAYWSLFSSVSNRPPTLEFTVKEGSGYTGLGTSYLSDAGTYTSNLTTWSTYLMYSTVTNLNVWNLTITNGGTINYGGTNIPTINPTISYIPYNLNGTNFADSVMYQSSGAINIADPGLDSELWVRDTAPTSTAKANLGSAETNAWLQLDAGGVNATVLLSPNAGSGVPSPFKPFYLHTTYTVNPGVNLFEIFNNGTTNFAVDASSGYGGTGTKVLTDNGTYQTASSVITGAISSQLLWTNSPTGGGSLTASSNVIASLPTGLYGSVFNNSEDIFAAGENAGQGEAVLQSTNLYNIGLLSGYGMTGNEAWMVMNIGDAAGRSATIYNSQDVYNFGIAPGELAQITNGSWVVMNIGDNAGYAMVTDKSQDIFNYGWLSGDSMGVSNSIAIFNYGDWAGRNNISVIQNSQEIYNYGYAAGVDQNPRNSTNLYNYGNIAGGVQQAIEVNGYYNYGTDSGWMGVGLASNSEELYNYGAWAGASLAALVADGTFVNFTNVYNYGPEAGMQIKGTNATYVLNYGYRAGEQSTMTGVSDLYNYGSDSGFQSTYDTSASDIYNYGTSAGKGASYTNAFFILNSGNSAGQSMVAQDSSSILNLGSYAGANMVSSNSTDLVNIGAYAGNLSALTNSTHVYTWGYQAGRLLAGDGYTNIYLLGDNAQPTRKTNEFGFGDTNYLYTFPGLDGIHAGGAMFSAPTYAQVMGQKEIACWGDSLSENTYEVTLSGLYSNSITVYSGGVGSETSTQIAARMLADTARYQDTVVIWAGRNNYASPAQIRADIASMVAVLPTPKRFLVLSILNGDYASEYTNQVNWTNITVLNASLAALYPTNYYDIRSYLVSQYNPLVPQDVIDHANDVPPSSLRSGQIHLNAAGYALVAAQVKAYLDANAPLNAMPIASQLPTIFASPYPIGNVTPALGAFTFLSSSSNATVNGSFTVQTNAFYATNTTLGVRAGFGTTTPATNLNGLTTIHFYNTGNYLEVHAPTTYAPSGVFIRSSDDTGLDLVQESSTGNTFIDTRYNGNDGYMFFRSHTWTGGTPQTNLTISTAGPVGVGGKSIATGEALQVFGSVKASGKALLKGGVQDGYTNVLTSATGKDFFYVSVPNTNGIGGHVVYTVFATDGTDVQEISGDVKFAAVAKSTTVTASTADVQAPAVVTGGSTLTAALAANTSTNNVFALGVTATTSLTTTNLTIRWRLETPSTMTVNAIP